MAGGFDAPDFLGTKATFSIGCFGGHGTETLRAGDTLKLAEGSAGPDGNLLLTIP